MSLARTEKLSFYIATAFVVYMPFHVFLSQSLSLATGGLTIWKGAKDVLLCVLVPLLLLLAYWQGAFRNTFFRRFIMLGGLYCLLYVLFLLFDKDANTKSAITAAVYNTRYFGYLLLGYVVASGARGKSYAKDLIRLLLLTCLIVAVFGVLQYFLPKNMLSHVGYSVERGVKPMFYIDDKLDFPRVMSTLRDPNSLGAFLALPIAYSAYFLWIKKDKQQRIMRDRWLKVIFVTSLLALVFTFSRSGLITTIVTIATMVGLAARNKKSLFVKAALSVAIVASLLFSASLIFKNSYVVENLLRHADSSTIQEDPNELRLSFGQDAAEHITKYPLGEGPGSAGLVAISNPKGGVLTENYYLQIAYEVGIVGLALFVAILVLVLKTLYERRSSPLALTLFCTGLGLAVFGLLNHSWSNESLAFVWWFPVGLALASTATSKK